MAIPYVDTSNRNKQTTNNLGLVSDPNKNKQTTNTLTPDTEIKPTDWVQMWTGQGYASVNPSAVQKKLAEGWSMSGPSQGQIGELINIAQQGSQGVWTPEGIKNLEGSTTTSTPTSTTTNTYAPLPGYQTVNAGKGSEILNSLKNAISSQLTNQKAPITTQPIVKTPVSDNASDISKLYGEQTNLLINQLKQKIAQSKAEQETIKANAPQQFDPLRSQSELAKAQQLRSVLERNANLGDRGGIGRSAALQTQVAGENRLNAINLQQQDVIDTANQRIADLESQGRFEEANILAQQRIAELQDAMAQQRLMEQRAYQESLTASDRAYQESLNASDRAYQESQQANEQQRADFNNTILANYNDLQAFANKLVSQGAPQWQIDAVLAARQQKISEQGLDQQGRPIQTGPTQDQWDNAYKKWNSGIPLTQQEMQILGTNVAVQPKSTSGGSQRTTTVTQDRSFQEDRWKRLGKADEQVAATWGVPVGTPYNSQITQEPADITPYQNFIENNFVTKATDMSPRTVNRMGITRYIYGLIEDNKFAEADLLASIYGITDSEFDAIEASLGNQRR